MTTLKKIHLKKLSAKVVFCKFLLTYLTNLSIETNSVDPDQTVRSGFTLFAGKASKTFRQRTKNRQLFGIATLKLILGMHHWTVLGQNFFIS